MNIIDQCRTIAERWQAAKVDGVMVDALTASRIVQIYDALEKPENKAKLAAMPIERAADICWKLG